MRERLRPSRIQLTTGQTLFTPRCWACCWPRGPPGLGGRCLLRRCSFSWPEPRSACARRTACWPDVSRSPSPLTARACGPTFRSFAKGAFGAKAGESPAPPNSAGQIFPAYAEVLQVAQDGQGDVSGIEEGPRDGLHVAGGDGFDARHQFVEREEPAEVHLLARQVGHPAGAGFQAQHERALEIILAPAQLFFADGLFLELAELVHYRRHHLAGGLARSSRINGKAAGIAVRAQFGEHRVRQPLALADVLEQARAHPPAQQGVEHITREPLFVRQRVGWHPQAQMYLLERLLVA